MRNSPHVPGEDWNEFGHRFGVFYARRGGQDTGELLAGYLNHEDPRPRISSEHGVWNRTRAAILSVLVVSDQEGNVRPAFAPIAGALGSGMMGMAFYRRNNGLGDGFKGTGISYSTYFATALVREFHPDLSLLASHLLHKKKQD